MTTLGGASGNQGKTNDFKNAQLLTKAFANSSPNVLLHNKEKRIVLLKPPIYNCATFAPIRSAQPLGIWQLGSYLHSKGYEVRIIDTVMEGWGDKTYLHSGEKFDYRAHLKQRVHDLHTKTSNEFLQKYPVTDSEGKIARTLVRTGLSEDTIVERIRDFDPGVIGISIIATGEHRGAMDLAKRLRREFPEARIIAGGQHATDMAERVLRDSAGSIDFVVKGNGEITFESLLRWENPGSGLAYLRDGVLIDQPNSPLTPMSLIQPYDPALLAHVPYPMPTTHSHQTVGRYTDWMMSFGCHKACDFCRQGNLRDGYRHLSLEQVKAQLRVFKDYGYRELLLQDDSLLGGPNNDGREFFNQAMRLIKEFGFFWQDNGGVEFERLDTPTISAILEMNDMYGPGGCRALYIPFNPRFIGDNRALERHMGKRPENFKMLKRLRNGGIYVYSSWIWGHVDQSVEDMEANTSLYEYLLKEKYIDLNLIFGLSYLPNTKDWVQYREHIVDVTDWEGYNLFVPHARTTKASFLDVNLAVLDAYRRLNALQPDAEPWAYSFPPTIPSGWK